MSYETPSFWQRLGGKGLAVATAVGIFLLVKVGPVLVGFIAGHGAVDLLRSRSRASSIETSLNDLTSGPRFGGTYLTMQREFPSEYETFKSQLRDVALNSSSQTDAFVGGRNIMKQWVGSKREYIAKADDLRASKVLKDEQIILSYLRNGDVAACASFGMTGNLEAQNKNDETLNQMSARALNDTLLAIKSGMSDPAAKVAALTVEDQTKYAYQISLQDFPPEIKKLATSDALARSSPDEQCQSSLLLVTAANSLPEPQRGRVARYFLNSESR